MTNYLANGGGYPQFGGASGPNYAPQAAPSSGGNAGGYSPVKNSDGTSSPAYGGLAAEARSAPATQINYSQSNAAGQDAFAARGDQSGALGLIRQAAQGNAPSAAGAQFNSNLNQSMLSNMALANSARGGGAAMAAAQQGAQMQNAQAAGAANQQSAALRAQEMAQARGEYMQGASGMRGQDLSQQGIYNQMGEAQAGMQMQQNALNQQGSLGYLGLQQSGANANIGANASMYGADQGRIASEYGADSQFDQAAIGAIAGGASGAMSVMSDERLKIGQQSEGTKGRTSLADGFLEHLHPMSYQYRDPSNEPRAAPTGGRYLGVMAQDVERAPGGANIVQDTPRGKAIELAPMVSGLAAGVGRLHERLAALEAQRHGRKGGE